MATDLATSCSHGGDEDYIDLEISSSSSSLLCYSARSPPQTREFEFQMSSIPHDQKETTASPADELFYKGKLLPLHLPPRLQIIQNLLQNPNTKHAFEDKLSNMPFISTTAPSTNTSTPLESCNISPSESCRVSSELNPDEYFFEWSTELKGFITDHPKKSWSRKLKLMKQCSLSQKLKASREYLKSLFSKSGCSDESCAKAAGNEQSGYVSSRGKEGLSFNKYTKVGKENQFGQVGNKACPTLANVMKSIDQEGIEESFTSHRKSFSSAIKRHSTKKSSSSSSSSSGASSSSSSFSFNSNGLYELQFLKRSSSAPSDIDGSIEAAIAYCKKSQQPVTTSKNTLHEAGFCSFSVSRIAASRDQDRPGLCRI
ncbi:hypothetical protein RJ640_024207 [Escallonia rubra]|uniref:Membrane-associated kinase regulator 4 n=1 Tax=Escallonia rubra TaxID=112253 RepID=A0AA88RD83_9ASTE|nr:hypothetical protein RJ640_024207 [Escallonia rubra]